jgi:hypothetical protein
MVWGWKRPSRSLGRVEGAGPTAHCSRRRLPKPVQYGRAESGVDARASLRPGPKFGILAGLRACLKISITVEARSLRTEQQSFRP